MQCTYNKRGIISQDQLTNHIINRMKVVYHENWKIDESKFPIDDNAVFITYRVRDPEDPYSSWMKRYHDFTRLFMKLIIRSNRHVERKSIHSRESVGMYACDYGGSKTGHYVSGKYDPHIHSVIVIHPEMRELVMLWLNMHKVVLGSGFYFTKIRSADGGIYRSVHYSLKGIMNEKDFYPGRNDQWMMLGPKDYKLDR